MRLEGVHGDNPAMDEITARTAPETTPADIPRREEWQRRLSAVRAPTRALLAAVVDAGGPELADLSTAACSPTRAARFLDPDQVRDRLKPTLRRWLAQLLSAGTEDADTVQAVQEHVGHVHARIGIPVDLVSRGARMVKDRLHRGIRAMAQDDAQALDAIVTADALIDTALEAMTRAYTRSREAARDLDGSFRLFSLIQNVGTERERQRALLLA